MNSGPADPDEAKNILHKISVGERVSCSARNADLLYERTTEVNATSKDKSDLTVAAVNATPREEKSTLRERESDNINSTLKSHIVDASLKRRARLLITNSSIPRQTRSLIRYALETKDPHLAQVVRRVEAGEMNIHHVRLE